MVRGTTPCVMISIALALSMMGCRQEKTATEQPAEETNNAALVTLTQASIAQIELKTETISRKPFAKSFVVPAKVVANQDNEALVGSLVQGRVFKVLVKTGDYVKTGQELMLLEGMEIGEIKAGFLSAKANFEYQKSNFDRQKKLFEEKVGSQRALLEAQNEYEKANAEYHAEKSRISAIGLSESEVVNGKGDSAGDVHSGTLSVRAPIGGVVVERNVVIGQLIEATTTAFRIINLSSVWVDGQMYEKDVGAIAAGSEADFHVPSYASEIFKGKVAYVGQIIDEKTRTMTVRAEFSNANGKLKPQMFGELRIPRAKDATALVVPAEALVRIDNADFIFVQKSDSTFARMPVTVGATQNELLEIVSGLQEGDRAVVKGAFYLKSELLKSSLGGE